MTHPPAVTFASIVRSPFLYGYLAVYAGFLVALGVVEGFNPALPLFVFAVIGVGFSAAVLLATRRFTAPTFAVRHAGRESAVLVFYLVVCVGGYLVWGMPALGTSFAPGSAANLLAVLAKKLVLFVVVPFLLFRVLWGYRLRDLADLSFGWRKHLVPALWISLALIPFQLVAGGGLAEIRKAGASPATLAIAFLVTFIWILVEVGLVEEFSYRVLLQSRLAAWLKSEVGGVFLMALVFGLTHAPGLYFRAGDSIEALGASPSPLMAVGYSIVVVSVVSLFLGFLWARTRNLPMLIVVHAAFDLIPKVPATLKAFFAG